MIELPGKEMKFTVIENADIEEYLDEGEKSDLSRFLWKIGRLRKLDGKVAEQAHLVISTDEPYVQRVVDILKENGRWVMEYDPNQLQFEIVDDILVLPGSKD
ncbi:hypothetical protein [Paenibacillus donghaensis]|uniref:Uncharacterized protein n=1 Tax=Paenibacillus donghaensis TaxID=414771 RepID=A0A2Z2KFK5_9BACL|nr:hypothetical protein [Paenibacillus donghaensis]ASA20909.1 hypothetical protein B9T62_09000 [Paenibacillus donghaensis]